MKVKFKFGIRTYSGTVDDMTYGSYKDDKLCIGRQWVMPALTGNNAAIGSAAKNLATLWASASAGYKADFKTYAQRYGKQISGRDMLPPTGYSLWIKAMYAWAKDEDPELDLSTLIFEDIVTLGGKVASVSTCIANEYLPAVDPYDDLIAEI